MFKYLLLILCCFHIFATCGSNPAQAPQRPAESYKEIPVENEVSVINIPIRIERNELQRQINAQLAHDIYSDLDATDDGMLVKVTKRADIEIELHENEIFYRVPTNLWIQKNLAITSAEARGGLDLVFKTSYSLYEDWTIETQTEITGHEWTDKPVLKLGFAKFPIESIASMIVNRAQAQVAAAIDEQVKNSLDLTENIRKAWLQLHLPVEASSETWLLPNPKDMSIAPLTIDGDTVETTVQIQVNPQIFIGERPATPAAAPVPALKFAETEDENFQINITTEIPFKEAQKIALASMDDYTFTQAGKTVKITDIELFGQGNKLVVGTQLEGAYNGKIYLKGKPEFSEKRNRIELNDVDFDFSSKKFLMSSLTWLFKGKLKSIMQENMDFQVATNIGEMKKLIAEQFAEYKITEGVVLNGNLDELAVQKVYITTDAIRLTVLLEGDLVVKVGNL